MPQEQFRFQVEGHATSGVWTAPHGDARALLVLGHGIANDREHFLLRGLLEDLAERGFAGVRFNYPFKEENRRDLDGKQVQFETFLAAMDVGRRKLGVDVPLVIGGKSLSARIAAALQAESRVAQGLVYLGFPLHRADATERLKDRHVRMLQVPQLFVAGDRDPLCHLELLRGVLDSLESSWTLHVLEDADHSLGVSAQGDDVRSRETVARIAGWIEDFIGFLGGA